MFKICSCIGLKKVLFMILEIKSGRLPCTLSRMSSGIQPLAGLFEIWLRDAGAARMGHSAEATWQMMRRDMHKAGAKPTGLSQQYMQSPWVCPIGGRKQLSQRVCPDGSAQTSCKAYADNRKTQPDNSVPSRFKKNTPKQIISWTLLLHMPSHP